MITQIYDKKCLICVDDYLSPETCKDLIQHFEKNIDSSYIYYNSSPLQIYYDEFIHSIIKDFSIPYTIDKIEIVKREIESYMDYHYDPDDKLSFVVYLNDDYEGGETFLENGKIIPKVGRIILFSGGEILHGVTPISKGTRYVLIGWFV